MKRKIVLSIILSVMTVLLLPSVAFAAEEESTGEEFVQFLEENLLVEDLEKVDFEQVQRLYEETLEEIASAEEERRFQASLRTGTPEANRELARYLSGQLYGWSNDQFACLDNLVKSESSWRRAAQNPRSTAYGIFQFLNSTWGMTSYRKSSDAEIQIKAGFQYISKVYGTPCRAWGFKLATLKQNSSYAPSDLRGKARVWISKGYTGY